MADTDSRPALVIDGMSVLRTVAGPAAKLRNGYTYSFVVQLTAAVKKFKPRGIFVCWEGGFDHRLKVDPTYKRDRQGTPQVIRDYRENQIKPFLKAIGADQFYADGYEADDVGAMFANTLEKAVLFSADKDWLQLVRPGISVYQKVRGTGRKEEKKEITHENFHKLTGFSSPEEFVRYLCAAGDGVDGISGIAGIGEPVIKGYLLGMEISPTKKERLDEFFAGDDLYIRNKKLIDLRHIRELPGLNGTFGQFDEDRVKSLLEEFTFASMLRDFPTWVSPYREACG